MAITLGPAASSFQTRTYFHTKKQVEAVKNLIASNPECLCLPQNCETPMPQFINRIDQGNPDENDFHSFIFELINLATMECTITNLSTDASVLIVNNDFGFLEDIGSYALRPNVWSLRLNWNDTFDQLGYGKYQFNFTVKSASGSVIYDEDSICFQLQPWDCEEAHGTVRIQTRQKGYIVGGFDYTNITTTKTLTSGGFTHGEEAVGWDQQIRWFGRFYHQKPITETDYIDSNQYTKEQIQQLVVRNYNLSLHFTRVELSKPLIEDHFMANEIYISDYNIGQHEIIRNKRVIFDEFVDFPDEAMAKDVTFNTKFSDYAQDKRKRNN